MAPGVLWVAALLRLAVVAGFLFKSDADDGTLEQLALSGQGLTVIVIAKTVAHWLVSGAALVVVSPLVATALGIPAGAFSTMLLSLALGTLTLSWLGAIGAGLTVGLRRGNVLLSLIVLPLAVPLLVFGAGCHGSGHFRHERGRGRVFSGVALRIHVYIGALRGDRRAAHHARLTEKTNACGLGSIDLPRPRMCTASQRC